MAEEHDEAAAVVVIIVTVTVAVAVAVTVAVAMAVFVAVTPAVALAQAAGWARMGSSGVRGDVSGGRRSHGGDGRRRPSRKSDAQGSADREYSRNGFLRAIHLCSVHASTLHAPAADFPPSAADQVRHADPTIRVRGPVPLSFRGLKGPARRGHRRHRGGDRRSLHRDAAARHHQERLREPDPSTLGGKTVEAGQVHWHGRTQTRRVASACSGASWQPTAAHFRDHADFTPRWRALPYSCVEHAEFVEQADDVMRRGSHDGGRTRSGTTSPGIRPARVPRL